MKYQLWTQDEYGTSAIVGTFEKHQDAIAKARKLVTDANFSNSLSSIEQMRNIEAYLVEICKNDKIDDNFVYAGNRRGGKFWYFKAGEKTIETFDADKLPVSIYIGSKFDKVSGENVEKKIYLLNDKKKQVDRVNDDLLAGKAIYFVVPME